MFAQVQESFDGLLGFALGLIEENTFLQGSIASLKDEVNRQVKAKHVQPPAPQETAPASFSQALQQTTSKTQEPVGASRSAPTTRAMAQLPAPRESLLLYPTTEQMGVDTC